MPPSMTYRPTAGTARKVAVKAGSWPGRDAEARRHRASLSAWEAEGGQLARDGTGAAAMSPEYVARMAAQMQQWDADVDALVDRGDRMGVGARAAHDEGIMGLSVTRDAAHRAFQRIRSGSDLSGAQLRDGMNGAWDAMQRALEKLSAELTGR